MYDKEATIHQIGEENWEAFYDFMLGRQCGIDESGFDLYYIGDIIEFKNHL